MITLLLYDPDMGKDVSVVTAIKIFHFYDTQPQTTVVNQTSTLLIYVRPNTHFIGLSRIRGSSYWIVYDIFYESSTNTLK